MTCFLWCYAYWLGVGDFPGLGMPVGVPVGVPVTVPVAVGVPVGVAEALAVGEAKMRVKNAARAPSTTQGVRPVLVNVTVTRVDLLTASALLPAGTEKTARPSGVVVVERVVVVPSGHWTTAVAAAPSTPSGLPLTLCVNLAYTPTTVLGLKPGDVWVAQAPHQ